ncbi:MAG: hypothetical protein ACK417_10800 [Bacteroidia bacterium]
MRRIMAAVFTVICISFAANAQQTVLIPSGSQTEAFTGLKVSYDENGIKTAEIEFIAGKAEGKINRFHTNGELREIAITWQVKSMAVGRITMKTEN